MITIADQYDIIQVSISMITLIPQMHVKVLEKGKPEDVMPGIKGAKHSLPNTPINGMVNKTGGKVRLTFKLIRTPHRARLAH